MSEENAEIVRRIIDLVNARQIEEALAGVGDDFEVDWSNSIGPTKGVYRGRANVLEMWSTFIEAWESMRWEPEEIIDVNDTQAVVVNHVRMRGRGSGVDVDATGAQLWTFKDGVPRRLKLYQSRDEALEAAGPSE